MLKGKIIGISGKKGSGKDVVARKLFEKMVSDKAIILYLADCIKHGLYHMLKDYTDIEITDLYGPSGNRSKEILIGSHSYTIRHLLQTLGTEWGRECLHENVWLDLFLVSAERYIDNGFNVIVPDVRFINEASLIKNKGGIVIYIYRDGSNDDSHQSETEMLSDIFQSLVDYSILNNGTINDLYREVDMMNRDNI